MRYALISDIHGNLEALQAVLRDGRDQRIDRWLCLGDIVGYNADPGLCLELVRGLEGPIVQGNHDFEAAQAGAVAHFSPLAVAGVEHSRRALSPAERAFLGALPRRIDLEGFSLVHATFDRPEGWEYVLSPAEAERSLRHQPGPLAFFGHTHVPHLFAEAGGKVGEYVYGHLDLNPAKRYFINVGSVGQPRDGDTRAAYAVYDPRHRKVELRRVPYDVAAARAKIAAAGLPERLADRLTEAR